MNVQAIHRLCVDAANQCPQYSSGYDSYPRNVGTDYAATMRYWLQEDLLWDKGYHVYLPEWIVKEFDKVDPLRSRYRTMIIEV